MDDFSADITAVNSIAAVPTILEVICRSTGMGFAAVARVTENRWIACSVRDDIGFGLKPGGELEVQTTICHEIRQSGKGVIFDNADDDPVFAGHHTPAMYGLKSYISLPIMLKDGTFFGTLCAIDPKPARINTPETIGMFKLFAELIAHHLDALEQVEASRSDLVLEKADSQLREQFIAVLGHDLRNPLGAISSGAALLQRADLGGRNGELVEMIQKSARRMSELIGNVMDFAKRRLGDGMHLEPVRPAPMRPVIDQVVAELGVAWPDRVIEVDCCLDEDVACDRYRIAQLFSNLLGNALTYGAPDQPIRVRARSGGEHFELSVANAGEAISPAGLARLFQPFVRGEVRANQQGLGLGLYIASEIAHAHSGQLTVTSTAEETRFTFLMPARA